MLRCITGQQRLDLLKAQWILDEALVVSSPISLLMPVQSVFIELDHHLHMYSYTVQSTYIVQDIAMCKNIPTTLINQ